jgi:hypothetical protein
MKKIMFLVAFTCTIPLFGMEQPTRTQKDIENLISAYVSLYPSLHNTIEVIKNKSTKDIMLHHMLNDISGFTKIMHILKNNYAEDMLTIAQQFNTQISKQYVTLASDLFEAIRNENIKEVIQLLNRGADVNFNTGGYDQMTPLSYAIMSKNKNMVQALLTFGANISLDYSNPNETKHSIVDYAKSIGAHKDIVELLHKAWMDRKNKK